MTLRDDLRQTGVAVRQVFAQRDLRHLLLAWAGSMTGEYAFATAIAVWAYNYGGASAVAGYVVVRLTLIALSLPVTGLVLARLPFRRFLVGVDLIRLGLVTAAAIVVLAAGPPPVVLILAVGASLVGAPSRPAHSALVPTLARTPQEVTAANAVAGLVEGMAYFVGPATAGVLLLLIGVPAVFALVVLTLGWSVVFLLRVRAPDSPAPPEHERSGEGLDAPVLQVASVASAGFRAPARDRRLLLVGGLACAQTVLSGAGLVFIVAVAHDLARLGDPGVGYLGSALGIGALVGSLVTVARAALGRTARDFGWGVLLWGLAPLVIAAWPATIACFAAFVVMGLGNGLVDVNTLTLVQRLAPAATLARVLVALETALMATMALGALAMPVLISAVGIRWALVAISLPLTVVVILGLPAIRRLDRTAPAPADAALIAGLPLFASLLPSAQEALARRLVTMHVPAGTSVVRQGEMGDRFYLIKTGRLDARQGERTLSTMNAGDCFGEIALLRDVPRTATVVAREDCVLAALERADFLAALDAHPPAATLVEDLVRRRLG